jgi:hypothetical protein
MWCRAGLVALLMCVPSAEAVIVPLVRNPGVLINEHADLDLGFNGTTWNVAMRNDDAGGAYSATHQTLLHVDQVSLANRPGGTAWDFIGVADGAPFFHLPAALNPQLLYLGNAAYAASPTSLFDRYNASSESGGRASGTGRWTRMNLDSVKGPGHFSMWGGSFTPVRLISTAHSGPGAGDTDSFWVTAGGHTHFNYGFASRGLYQVNLTPSARQPDGNDATAGPVIASPLPFPVYFNVSPGYAVSRVTTAAALPNVGTITYFRGFRATTLADVSFGSVSIGRVLSGPTWILLDLVDATEAGALEVALSGFNPAPSLGLAAVPATAVVDNSVLANYPGYEVALRYDALPGEVFDFEFDYRLILDGVQVRTLGVLGRMTVIPEPGAGAVTMLLALPALCRRRRVEMSFVVGRK